MEAIVTVSRVSPVSGKSLAESEAKYFEPLSSNENEAALAATLAETGAEAEGREVLIVSLGKAKEAAEAFLGINRDPADRRRKKIRKFFPISPSYRFMP